MVGSLVVLALGWAVFREVAKAKLPFTWTLALSFGGTYVIAMVVMEMLGRLLQALNNPWVLALGITGLISAATFGISVVYLRRQYELRKDPYKHLR